HEHRVLTTPQIADLHFEDVRRARRRLLILHRKGVLERFRPYRPAGSAPHHYILGEVGARVVAATHGLDLRIIKQRMERDLYLMLNPRLDHLLEVNDFFVRLIKECRNSPDYDLTRWWGERRCSGAIPTLVHPDGLGRLTSFGTSCTFLLELDRGTERGDRLRRKLLSYGRLGRRREKPDAIMFLFHSERRERAARSKLELDIGIRVATSHRDLHEANPLARNWLPIDDDRRHAFIDLAMAAQNSFFGALTKPGGDQ
ncbi:MAG: replication-relaxation family protein, partial [Actinomycetota bacterium]